LLKDKEGIKKHKGMNVYIDKDANNKARERVMRDRELKKEKEKKRD